MNCALKGQQAKSLMQHFTGRRLPQGAIANPPPAESGAARLIEEWRDLV
jgi:hypothetical protein